jgi:hypothetical protein
MSNKPGYCKKCKQVSQCDLVAPLAADNEDLFTVCWKCPKCDEKSMVVSPTGPLLAPTPGMCLQCGKEGYVDGQPCRSCGLQLSEVMSTEEQALTDEALLQLARACFALGTCRRGLTIVNHVLRRNPQSGEAWSIKGQFLGHLGFHVALKTVMQEAVRHTQRDA